MSTLNQQQLHQLIKETIATSKRSVLTESGRNRLVYHMNNHDSAFITGWRHDRSRKQNQQINQKLKEFLLESMFGVTKVQNFEKEPSWFVVNLSDDKEFFPLIKEVGIKLKQDAVLLVPKGARNAYLYGTSVDGHPGLGNKIDQGSVRLVEGDEDTGPVIKIRNRPVAFR